MKKLLKKVHKAMKRTSGIAEQKVRPEKLKLWEKISQEHDTGKGRRFSSAKEAAAFIEK